MKIKFLRRNRDGIEIVATLTFPNKWTGNLNIKVMVEGTSHKLWAGKFDPTNEEHYKTLPQVFSGSRLWAVEDKGRFMTIDDKHVFLTREPPRKLIHLDTKTVLTR